MNRRLPGTQAVSEGAGRWPRLDHPIQSRRRNFYSCAGFVGRERLRLRPSRLGRR